MKKKKQEELPVVNVYGQAIQFATSQFRAGVSEKTIVDALMEANSKFTPENIQFIIHRSSLEIADEYFRDRASIIGLHVRRYNNELKKGLDDKHLDIVLPHIRRQFRLKTLETCLEIMFAKERVLQIHGKDTQVKIFNRLNAKIKERKIAYDLSTLSLQEKIDFLALVTKAKRSQDEVFSVQLKPKEVETIDIEHEEVPVNNNIALIERTNDKGEEVVLPEVTIHNVMDKIKLALQKRADKELKARGAKELAPNPIDLRKQDFTDGMRKLQQEQTNSQ